MKSIIVAIFLCCSSIVWAQKTKVFTDKTFKVGYLLDSTFKKNNIFTEFSFGKMGGLFSTSGSFMGGRSIVMNFETSFRAGFFPTKRLLVGLDFTPYFSVSDRGMEGFRWSTGPFMRYYFPFYRVNKKNELRSPVALYVFFNSYFGQYNPMVLDRPFDSRFTGGFAVGVGFAFNLGRNLCLNIELGPRYDFYSSEFSNQRFSTMFKIGLSYSFATPKEKMQKKYKKITGNQ